MKAVIFHGAGDIDVMSLDEVASPRPAAAELLVRVAAAGVNRADILQRRGFYPPPPGESTIPGLEIAGEVVGLGPDVTGFQIGDRVFGLVAGGGYSELCCLHSHLAMRIPGSWDYLTAAAIPETYFTAGETLFQVGRLIAGEKVLIHAGGSGVGSTAIQMARLVGAQVFTTVGNAQKAAACLALGAQRAIEYKNQDFVSEILQETDGQGVNLILDFIGASYLERNLKLLSRDGRLVLVGLLGGARAELNLGLVLSKRLQILGSVMRSVPLEEKIAITNRFRSRWLPLLVEGQLHPVIHGSLPIERVGEAHSLMESSQHFGKIVLTF